MTEGKKYLQEIPQFMLTNSFKRKLLSYFILLYLFKHISVSSGNSS